jgi:hypothetical protein
LITRTRIFTIQELSFSEEWELKLLYPQNI